MFGRTSPSTNMHSLNQKEQYVKHYNPFATYSPAPTMPKFAEERQQQPTSHYNPFGALNTLGTSFANKVFSTDGTAPRPASSPSMTKSVLDSWKNYSESHEYVTRSSVPLEPSRDPYREVQINLMDMFTKSNSAVYAIRLRSYLEVLRVAETKLSLGMFTYSDFQIVLNIIEFLLPTLPPTQQPLLGQFALAEAFSSVEAENYLYQMLEVNGPIFKILLKFKQVANVPYAQEHAVINDNDAFWKEFVSQRFENGTLSLTGIEYFFVLFCEHIRYFPQVGCISEQMFRQKMLSRLVISYINFFNDYFRSVFPTHTSLPSDSKVYARLAIMRQQDVSYWEGVDCLEWESVNNIVNLLIIYWAKTGSKFTITGQKDINEFPRPVEMSCLSVLVENIIIWMLMDMEMNLIGKNESVLHNSFSTNAFNLRKFADTLGLPIYDLLRNLLVKKNCFTLNGKIQNPKIYCTSAYSIWRAFCCPWTSVSFFNEDSNVYKTTINSSIINPDVSQFSLCQVLNKSVWLEHIYRHLPLYTKLISSVCKSYKSDSTNPYLIGMLRLLRQEGLGGATLQPLIEKYNTNIQGGDALHLYGPLEPLELVSEEVVNLYRHLSAATFYWKYQKTQKIESLKLLNSFKWTIQQWMYSSNASDDIWRAVLPTGDYFDRSMNDIEYHVQSTNESLQLLNDVYTEEAILRKMPEDAKLNNSCEAAKWEWVPLLPNALTLPKNQLIRGYVGTPPEFDPCIPGEEIVRDWLQIAANRINEKYSNSIEKVFDCDGIFFFILSLILSPYLELPCDASNSTDIPSEKRKKYPARISLRKFSSIWVLCLITLYLFIATTSSLSLTSKVKLLFIEIALIYAGHLFFTFFPNPLLEPQNEYFVRQYIESLPTRDGLSTWQQAVPASLQSRKLVVNTDARLQKETSRAKYDADDLVGVLKQDLSPTKSTCRGRKSVSFNASLEFGPGRGYGK